MSLETLETRTFESELAHFGVKGMRWGVRKRSKESGFEEHHPDVTSDAKIKTQTTKSPTPVQAKIVPGKPVQTRGGKRHPTVDEAVIAAALKQKYHASGKQSLTNKEMQTLVERLTLEDRLSKVAPAPKSKGRIWTERFIKSPLTMLGIKEAQKQVGLSMKGVGTQGQYQAMQGLEFAERVLKGLQPAVKSKKKD